MEHSKDAIPAATLMRLPAYLRLLRAKVAEGAEYVSSAEIAEKINVSAVAVRKDLALVSSAPGKPRFGFAIQGLISDLEYFLGYHRRTNAVVVGAGDLGRAILGYDGFEHYGLTVVAAFDVAPARIGAVKGKPIYPMERLSEIVKREHVRIGVLAVPRSSAQEACDAMLRAGIKAILSLTPAHLNVPEGVLVKYEDMAASLAALSGALSES